MPAPKTAPSTLPLPPGRLGLPWIGETLSFLRDPNFATKRQAQYGSLFKSRIIGQPTVFFCGPEANAFLLSSHADCFSWRDGWPGTFQELLGESLFLQEGETHLRNRRLLMPAFHGKALASYFSTMVALSDSYLARWEKKQQLTWFLEFKKFTFEVASVLLVGSAPGHDETDNTIGTAESAETEAQIAQLASWFADLTNGLFTLPIRWGPTTYRKALRGRDRLLSYIEQEITKRRQLLARLQTDPTAALPTDVLTLLLQTEDDEGNRLSEAEIKVQTLLMLFAGHETTTSMLTSLVMSLAQNPDVLAKARAEQQAFPAESALTFEQIQQMPYLDQILKEVERQYPPVGGGFRRVIKPFNFNGYHVPAGWLALYRIDAAHKDERCYTNPSDFDPDRFSPERAEQKRYDYSLVGFGGGPRVCLGMAFAKLEMKIMAAQLLRRYHWQLDADQDLTMNPVPSLRPADGLKVRFSKLSFTA
ncbi:MAG: cytochrome P450 [Phormidesmis priestleyi Ana]|uniref:Cytochrome P450 n=1 Tax=Phormidesmis priestleyi Ana TaxID=1666911 RepID=A0A0P8DFR4_9CYAN|nr:MAG: cytochrome P450 [Phormidesmis priestleyi Ana]